MSGSWAAPHCTSLFRVDSSCKRELPCVFSFVSALVLPIVIGLPNVRIQARRPVGGMFVGDQYHLLAGRMNAEDVEETVEAESIEHRARTSAVGHILEGDGVDFAMSDQDGVDDPTALNVAPVRED